MANRRSASRNMGGKDEVYVDFENFKLGLWDSVDSTKAPFGSARIMRNVQVTDAGGLAPRPGTQLLGTKNTTAASIKGLYNFKRSFAQDELLIKTYDDELEVYSKNHTSAGWFRLKNGFTSDKEFGFVSSLVNNDNDDYVIFCNRYEPYQRWSGAVALLSGSLAGGETSVTVDSVLLSEIYDAKTATSASATTVDVSGTPWAASMWINMYIYIKTGTHAGKIRKITANTTSQLTFDTLGTTPGTADFEIRKSKFPASGTIIYNGTTIAYTAIPEYNKFTVGSAHTSSSGVAVSLVPTEYPGAPRGNRLTNYLGRIVVGNVRSAVARDSGGAYQGYSSAGSYFVSKINTPTDFGYSGTRVAGEGDVIGTPYGGGDITDVQHQEDVVYVFKPRYIEAAKYSQDTSDLIVREPLKAEVGSAGRVIKGSDDIYFITEDKKFTSIGRTLGKDLKPQTVDIGYKIKRLLDDGVFTFGKGIEYGDKIFIPGRSSSSFAQNNIVLVYSKNTDSFWGQWDLPVNFIERFNGGLYYGDSLTPNVYQMLVGRADIDGTDRFPISAQYASHFMNLTPSDGTLQSLKGMYYEGHIREGSTVTFKAWKDFSSDPFLSFDFRGDAEFLSGNTLSAALGLQSFGLAPLGSISEADSDGRRYFQFRVYFPPQYGYHFSVGFQSVGADFDYELTRMGLLVSRTLSTNATRVKSI